MELTHGYRSAPGCCTVCSSSHPGPVVDLVIQDRGIPHRLLATYLCSDCSRQIASLILPTLDETIVPSDYVGRMETAVVGLEGERDDAVKRAERAEGLLRDLREGAWA